MLVAEGSPTGGGHETAAVLGRAGVPVVIIEPRAVARYMTKVALVLVGADAILEDGTPNILYSRPRLLGCGFGFYSSMLLGVAKIQPRAVATWPVLYSIEGLVLGFGFGF